MELLNLLRPTVAVSRFIVFAARALHLYPEWRRRLLGNDEVDLLHFVQEVRRTTPFFPFAVARVSQDFTWQGYHFPEGRRAILDLYGTNHHPSLWEAPYEFRPQRFVSRPPGPFDLIPQGGGNPMVHHRCAGEAVTVSLLAAAVRFLVRSIRYQVPEQDLGVRLDRIPARPESGFVIEQVHCL